MSAVAFRMRARRRGGRLRPAWRQPLAIVGSMIAVAWIVVAIFAPFIAPLRSARTDLRIVAVALGAPPVRNR